MQGGENREVAGRQGGGLLGLGSNELLHPSNARQVLGHSNQGC